MTYFSNVGIRDGANLDSFSRLRVSNPVNLLDAQFTYDLQPTQFEQIVSGSGASVTHDTTNRAAIIAFSSTPTGGNARLQSYKWFRYTPGKSQLVFMTFNMNGGVSNCIKFARYGDSTNAYEFRLNGTTPEVRLVSATTAGTQTVAQTNWNIDKLDGTGLSGITIDFTKTQILVIDFQALYVGRVRFGFDIGGVIVYFHQFLNSNSLAYPYIQTASLPISAGMTCTGTVTATMLFVCSNVSGEGGSETPVSFGFSQEGSVTAGSGTRTHVLSIRPKATFNTFTNRSLIIPDTLDATVTGNSPVLIELCVGVTLTGTTTFGDINTTYSASEFNTAGTLSGNPLIVVSQMYVGSSASTKTAISKALSELYPITLDAGGNPRTLGTISILATGLGGASAMRAALEIREVR